MTELDTLNSKSVDDLKEIAVAIGVATPDNAGNMSKEDLISLITGEPVPSKPKRTKKAKAAEAKEEVKEEAAAEAPKEEKPKRKSKSTKKTDSKEEKTED